MLKKLLFTTALSGLMLSSALAQAPSGDAMKSDAPTASPSTSGSASTITSQGADQMLVSNLRGVDVMGSNNEKIGDISDILISKDGRVHAFLLSVGGFLGVGAKEVALEPSSIQLSQDGNNWKAQVTMSKDQLAQAPGFERTKAQASTTGSGAGGPGSMQRSTSPSGSTPATKP